jgi:hypothetical protein
LRNIGNAEFRAFFQRLVVDVPEISQDEMLVLLGDLGLMLRVLNLKAIHQDLKVGAIVELIA